MTVAIAKVSMGEQEKVNHYRFEQMVASGIRRPTAARLSRCTCDLHEVLDAKAQGCTDALLRKIFDDD